MNLTIRTKDGHEIYQNAIYEYIQEYLDENGIDEDKLKNPSRFFRDLCFYLNDRIGNADRDIDNLDKLWQVFRKICSKFGLVVTLQAFGILAGIDNRTFSEWQAGSYRSPEYGETVKKWKYDCEADLAYMMANDEKTSVNRIFMLKANFNWRETAPIPFETPSVQVLTAAELPQIAYEKRLIEAGHGQKGE